MPELPNDFSSLKDKHKKAIAYVYQYNNIVKGLRDAGYKDTNDQQLKINYRKLMKRDDAQKYLSYIQTHPDFLKSEIEWFNRLPIITKKTAEYIVPVKLTEQNKNFLEIYFIVGDKFRAMQQAFPERNYTDQYRSEALRQASRILANDSSIEYMNMLNERSLNELFLSKSKIIKDVYDLAKDCKDSKSRFAAVKAYELLARMTGLLNDNKSVNVNEGGKIEINYIVPDKIDTTLHQDINEFLKDGPKDAEYELYKKDQKNEGQEE